MAWVLRGVCAVVGAASCRCAHRAKLCAESSVPAWLRLGEIRDPHGVNAALPCGAAAITSAAGETPGDGLWVALKGLGDPLPLGLTCSLPGCLHREAVDLAACCGKPFPLSLAIVPAARDLPVPVPGRGPSPSPPLWLLSHC